MSGLHSVVLITVNVLSLVRYVSAFIVSYSHLRSTDYSECLQAVSVNSLRSSCVTDYSESYPCALPCRGYSGSAAASACLNPARWLAGYWLQWTFRYWFYDNAYWLQWTFWLLLWLPYSHPVYRHLYWLQWMFLSSADYSEPFTDYSEFQPGGDALFTVDSERWRYFSRLWLTILITVNTSSWSYWLQWTLTTECEMKRLLTALAGDKSGKFTDYSKPCTDYSEWRNCPDQEMAYWLQWTL